MMNKKVTDRGPLVRVSHAVKTYGPTTALSGVNLHVNSGEVLGIVGHNGAGKSTLMRMLCGIESLDSGSIDFAGMSTRGRNGFPDVRMAYQEGSLALELSVKDNIFMSSSRWMPRLHWHRFAADRASARLNEIFPENGIKPADFVDDLPISDRQMVEIARATITDKLRLLILDEPTESLGREAVEQLYTYVRKLRDQNVAIVLVSHRLREILSVCTRIAVMKDGAVSSICNAEDVTERDLFLAMGGEVVAVDASGGHQSANEANRPVAARVPMETVDGEPAEFIAREGEVVGLAGIAGQGQERVLERLWRGARNDVEIGLKRAYVPGDRQRSGILPLWNVASNLTISALAGLSRRGIRQTDREGELVANWIDRLKIRGGAAAAITGLSGGNQQKVIVARAFASDAKTILLDDPFRGVDIHTKAELYQLIRTEAEKGRTIIWYSSENSEMQHCDRAYVLRANKIAGQLQGAQITDERIIAMSFAEAKDAAA
ncbi:ATP-binding cassette domain-containing protein [Algicella marina]|uniref:ATP-binding cassette domain-containing protein n=1 Tax=Algicella marina TaxID=2683284 RepID=A0A6P1T0N5_9RHOB|nr:sugar ABC transporter ATP-binding protein [Algicella marina]QHQ36298.1 ATP-binding cassette domain-containing protein [Algicella marina]